MDMVAFLPVAAFIKSNNRAC